MSVSTTTEVIRALHEKARRRWPGVHVSLEEFIEHVARRQDSEDGERAVLTEDRGAELYLALGCALRVPKAADAFEASYGCAVERHLARLDSNPSFVAEVAQDLRVKLLAGPRPLLGEFTGRGGLAAWLRAVVVHAGLKALQSARRREKNLREANWTLAAAAEDPEVLQLRASYGAHLKEAFAIAVSKLTMRQRNVLRQRFIDGLTIDELAPLYAVNRATVARWIAGARAELVESTKLAMCEALGLEGRDVDSVLRLIRSQLDLSITRHLQP